jgi:hypothetical protein
MDTSNFKATLRKVGTLGGQLKINQKTKHFYFGDSKPGGPMSKERLFGIHGPLLIGMPNPSSQGEELALEANVSDTRQGLIQELTNTSELTRRQAEQVVAQMIASGKLAVVKDPELGEILVWGGRPK